MKRLSNGLAAAGILAVGAAGCSGPESADNPPDTILYNGNIVTVDPSSSYAQAVAITGDRFEAVGPDATVRALAGPRPWKSTCVVVPWYPD